MNRRSTPKVRDGRVQKKNNWTPAPNYYNTPQSIPVIDRLRPGQGYRHLLKRHDVEEFISIVPEWDELAIGLNAVVLAPGDDAMGWHEPGVVHVCAWEDELWWHDADPDFVQDHSETFGRLGVVVEKRGGRLVVKWTERQARAFQLLHVLLHELGHHHDRMTTRSRRAARGEPFAEAYARRHEAQIWDAYVRRFNVD